MADSDQSISNLRYNQVTQGLEGFGGGSPMWTPLILTADQSAASSIRVLASEPVSPSAGDIFFNSTTHQFEGYNGTMWVILG